LSAIAPLWQGMSILESDPASAIGLRGAASPAFLAPAAPSFSAFAARKRFMDTATVPVMARHFLSIIKRYCIVYLLIALGKVPIQLGRGIA
jgi:hypothetical protein